VGRGARGVVGIGDCLDPLITPRAALAGEIDAVGRLVGDLLIQELGGERAALAHQVALVDPAPRDLLELAEQVQLRLLARITEFPEQQVLGEMIGDRARPDLAQVLQVQRDAFADDALKQDLARADQLGRQLEPRVFGELRRDALVRQLDPVAFDAREADLERRPLLHGVDAYGLARARRLDDHGLGGEVEGHAQDVGVFDVEQAFLVQLVGLTAQRSTDHLLA